MVGPLIEYSCKAHVRGQYFRDRQPSSKKKLLYLFGSVSLANLAVGIAAYACCLLLVLRVPALPLDLPIGYHVQYGERVYTQLAGIVGCDL